MPATAPSADALVHAFLSRHPALGARCLQDQAPADVRQILADMHPATAAAIFARSGPDLAARYLTGLPPSIIYRLLAEADAALAAAVLRRMGAEVSAAAFVKSLPAALRREFEAVMSYPENSAGSLMDPTSPVFRADARAADVAAALAALERRHHHVIMTVDDEGRLQGTLDTIAILLAAPDARLEALDWQPAVSVHAFAHRDEVADAIESRRLVSMPVVDINNRPVGLLSHGALAHVAAQEAATDLQSMVGVSREERALSSVGFAVRKRLPWLQINLATAFLAAAVVGLFEQTIATFTALAVLLPVVAGQSGNTGAQSLAVTMRGLTLHEIGLRQWVRIVVKEASVGLVNGVAVAAVTVVGVYLWSHSVGLCLVIGLAMILSMAIAGVAGAGVPLVLRAIGQDPAQSSSIVLTTVTDVMGFFSFLGLAALFAEWL
jgi:magnesium transporter